MAPSWLPFLRDHTWLHLQICAVAIAAWLLVSATYGELPALEWWLPAPLAVLALAEALGAEDRLARAALLTRKSAGGTRGVTFGFGMTLLTACTLASLIGSALPLVAKRIAKVTLGAYAHRDYLRRRGTPRLYRASS